MSDLGEFGSIARYLAPLTAKGGPALDLKDDAAVFAPPAGKSLVLTLDTMVAGVHFLADDPPALAARKLMRVNLSDLAAMGAEPLGYLLSCALPQGQAEHWMAALAEGLAADQEIFGWRLWGGDTVTTPGPATLSLTAVGAADEGRALTRSGAAGGDLIFVSGAVGGAALGLELRRSGLAGLTDEDRAYLERRFLLPEPRLALGRRLIGVASAAIDVSDGLAADLGHICRASGVAARLDLDAVPQSPAARAALELSPQWRDRLYHGDDYELLFTAPPDREQQIAALSTSLNLSLTRIGEIVEGEGVAAIRDGAPADTPAGYRHF